MNQSLKNMLQQYPLGQQWSAPQIHEVWLPVEGVRVGALTLRSRRDDGVMISSSAADCGVMPWERAYFELIGRASVVHAFDIGVLRRSVSEPADAYPLLPVGVASDKSFMRACERAAHGVLAHDRILRSWFGGKEPRVLSGGEVQQSEILCALSKSYEIVSCRFEQGVDDDGVSVCAIFCFPQKAKSPVLCGFGGAGTLFSALKRAEHELLRRLCLSCDFACGLEALRRWISGSNADDGLSARVSKTWAAGRQTRFSDITPFHLRNGSLFVIKATDDGRVPLMISEGYRTMLGDVPDGLAVHPLT